MNTKFNIGQRVVAPAGAGIGVIERILIEGVGTTYDLTMPGGNCYTAHESGLKLAPRPTYTIRQTERCFAVDADGRTIAWFKSEQDANKFCRIKTDAPN